MIMVRVAIPIAEGNWTGIIEIEEPSIEEMRAELDELGRYVEDISWRAGKNVRPDEVGFGDMIVPSTTFHACGPDDWCDHWEVPDGSD